MRLLSAFVLFVAAVIGLTGQTSAHAEDGSPLRIFYTHADSSSEESVELSTYFTLIDEGNQPLTGNINFENVQIGVDGGDFIATTPELARDTPIIVAIVLDTSGSMDTKVNPGSIDTYIDRVGSRAIIAISEIASTNPKAKFAVFSFDNLWIDRTFNYGGFTEQGKAISAVNSILAEVKSREKRTTKYYTCLLNATYQTIQFVNDEISKDKSTRRAIILFTDGKSEPPPSPEPQPTPSTEGVCQFDKKDPRISDIDPAIKDAKGKIPIYTIGLCGKDLNSDECKDAQEDLFYISSQTSGSSEFGNLAEQKDIDNAFEKIVGGLNSQWVARATVHPCHVNTGSFKGVFRFGETIYNFNEKIDFEFDLTRCFNEPTSATVELASLPESVEAYQFTMEITTNNKKSDAIKSFDVRVVKKEGSAVADAAHIEPGNYDPENKKYTIMVLKDRLHSSGSGEYIVEVRALDRDGTYIKAENGGFLLGSSQPIKYTVINVYSELKNLEKGNNDGTYILPISLTVDGESGIPESDRSNAKCEVQLTQDGLSYTGDVDFTVSPRMCKVEVPSEKLQIGTSYSVSVKLVIPTKISIPAENNPLPYTPLSPPQTTLEAVVTIIRNPFVRNGIITILLGVFAVLTFVAWRRRRNRDYQPVIPSGATHLKPQIASSRWQKWIQHLAFWRGQDREAKVADPSHKSGPTRIVRKQSAPTITKPRLRITIVTTPAPQKKREQTIETFPMVIGREKGLEKGKNYLLIEGDDAISRQHIEITMIGGVFKIKNISKSNETCVGEQELGFGETANLDGRATVRLGPDTTIEMESLG